jgi:hypothetical protein
MSQSVIEKAICEKCGVDARENTLFCYNCGNRLSDSEMFGGSESEIRSLNDDASSEPVGKPDTRLEDATSDGVNLKAKAALNELAERIRIEPPGIDDEAVALAAARRKKARGARIKPRECVWEPVEGPPGRLMLIIVGVITILAALAVVVTVVWK